MAWSTRRDMVGIPGVALRPIGCDDGPALTGLFQSLSAEDARFFHPFSLDSESAERIARRCADPTHRALVGVEVHPSCGALAAFGYLTRPEGGASWALGICVREDWQGRGLGTALLGELIDLTESDGRGPITLEVHGENLRAVRMYLRRGFRVTASIGASPTTSAMYRMVLDRE
jgi:ribosomal protein S18 acetylase RimI-like enzyme